MWWNIFSKKEWQIGYNEETEGGKSKIHWREDLPLYKEKEALRLVNDLNLSHSTDTDEFGLEENPRCFQLFYFARKVSK